MTDIWKYIPSNLQIFWYIHGPMHLQSMWSVWDLGFTQWCCRRFESSDVTLSSGASSSLCFVWRQAVFLDCLTQNMKALQSFKILGSTYTRQCHILEDLSLLSYVLTTSWPSLLKAASWNLYIYIYISTQTTFFLTSINFYTEATERGSSLPLASNNKLKMLVSGQGYHYKYSCEQNG